MYANNNWSASDNVITTHEPLTGVTYASLSRIERNQSGPTARPQMREQEVPDDIKFEPIFEDNVQSRKSSRANASIKSSEDEDKNGQDLKPSDFVFFASNSTFHGMSHIITSGRFTLRKALWAVAFFSSLSLFLVQAYDRYSYYRSHPHVTKLDEEEALEMNFPAITICNMNSFRLSAITTDDFYYAGKILGLLNDDYSMQVTFKDNRTWPDVSRKLQPILVQRSDYKPRNKKFDMFEFYNRTGHEMKGTVKRCRYRGTPCEGSKYWIPVYTRYGKCYTFNSGTNSPPLKTLKGGVDNGLEILLDTQQDQYMPVWKETDEISVEAGFKVQIHSQTEPPFIHELGFGVAPGFQTLVATQEQRITFLPDPWGKCIEGFDKSQHSHFKNYSISACRITCETKFIFDNCKCRMIHMPGDTPYCTPEQYMQCADSALDFLVKEDVKQCVCETPCDVTRYNLEMSTLQLPSTQALSYLAYKFQETEDYVKNNYVKLNIFFEALNYETIEQKVAYEIPGLFGDIGGQMGLFIGASILTILELFDYVYEVIKEKACGGKRKQKKNDIERGTLTEVDNPNIKGSGKDYVVANHQCVQPHSIEGGHQTRYTTPYNTYPTRHDDYLPTKSSNSYETHNHRNQTDDFRSLPPPPLQYTGRSTTPQPFSRSARGFVPRTNVSYNRREPNQRAHALSASYTDLNHYEEQQQQDNAHDHYSYKRPQYLQDFSTIDTGTTSFSGQVNPPSSSMRSRPESRIIAPTPIILSDASNPPYSAQMMMTSPQHNGMGGKEFNTASIETDIH
uniref:Acid-sensing ion channel 2 n=1 Tax=Phallusia mammillata TaxID=59560 RepID=A0A6F9D6S5_9ASCI|nr:acid-sensing ion channel 2 [Phallusia mammillata]